MCPPSAKRGGVPHIGEGGAFWQPAAPSHTFETVVMVLPVPSTSSVLLVRVCVEESFSTVEMSVTAFEPLVVASPESSAAVKAEALPRTRPVSVLAVPVPPCAMVTAVLEVSTVAEALGKVNVFSEVAGPVTSKNPLLVPP